MTTTLAKFDEFFGEFSKTPLWEAMVRTVENSPWHREANVGVHTQMLIAYYMDNFAIFRTAKQQMLSLVACLFHDVGKPPAEIIKHSEERGTYRAYHGHEQISARLWINYAMTNLGHVKEFTGFSLPDISNVALMLEHHVPFALKDKQKRKALKTAFITRMGADGHQAWLDLLNSDQHGRISDDQETKLAAVAAWMKEWETV